MNRKILSVFIASPSDLNNERKTLRDVKEITNKIFGKRIGWQIELLGWEDTRIGFSRPQALINKDVENCELFIGMLWKRWGTDSGNFSSGFEEEFTIAMNRRINGDKPEIWMFFKKIEEEQLGDPGEQLKKCIQFKKQLIENNQLLFKEFKDTNELKDTILQHLSTYLLDAYQSSQIPSSDLETEPPITKDVPYLKIEQPDSSGKKNDELVAVFGKIAKCLGDGNEDKIDYWERIRAHLSSSALFSQSHTGEVFGTHEINLVYLKRNEWNFSSYEKGFLTRTYFSDSSSITPVWFWLSGEGISRIEELLFYLSRYDRNDAVRKGALEVLYYSKTPPPIETMSALLTDDKDDIVIKAIRLIKYCDEEQFLGLLKPILTHKTEAVRNKALYAYIDLLYLTNPEESFSLLKEKSTEVTDAYKKSLESLDLKVSEKSIISSIFEGAPRIREYAAKYLNRADLLSEEISKKILEDTDPFVKKIGFDWLLNHGRNFSLSEISNLFPRSKEAKQNLSAILSRNVTEDDIIPLVLSRRTQKELESMVDYYSSYGREAYEALAVSHFSSMSEKFRSDLNNNIDSIKSNSLEKLKLEFGDKASLITQREPGLEKFVNNSFVASALKGLSKLNEKSDIQYARQYLGRLQYGMGNNECISIIENHGDQTDVDSLIKIAKNSYGDTKRKALNVAIKLSGNQLQVIQDLIFEKDKSLSVIGAKRIQLLPRKNRVFIAKKLLYFEDSEVRLLAAKILSKDLGRDEIETILSAYIEEDVYYYDVVSFVDGFLYAPGKFKNKFITTN